MTSPWPGGAECAVVITVDIDGDLPMLAEDPARFDREKSRSVGRYGTDHGAARILRTLTGAGVTGQWFLPGAVTEEFPELVRALAAAGQYLGSHGGHHLDFDGLDLAEQLEELEHGRNAIREATGSEVHGFRTPSGEWSKGLPEAAAARGFAWSSSLPADDRPFPLGASGLWEIPVRYELEDLQYLAFNLDPPFPPGGSRITPLETVEDNWWHEYLGAARYGTTFILRLNAEVIGTPGRSRMLARLLQRIQEDGRAWFATCDQLHEHVTRAPVDHSSIGARHPYELFLEVAPRELSGHTT